MNAYQQVARSKVMYVITKTNWGGAQRYVYDLAVAAKKQGFDVHVAGGGSGELLTRLTDAGVPTSSITAFSRDVHLLQEIQAFFELLTLFKKERPRVVHLNSSKAGIAALAARFARVPHIIFTVHGWAWNEKRPLLQKILITFVYWITLLLCHRSILVSKEAKRQARLLPFVQRKMTIIHNGVHPITYLSREEARKKLLPESKKSFWIGTIGELHPIKGHALLIEAFEHFAPDFPDSELVIIGEGEERTNLERLMRIEGVSGSTHLVGNIPEAATYLRAFDLFVLPSRSEGLPYVILEAGQAGLSVLATSVGGIPEAITDGETGMLIPYGDRGALTDGLEYLARNAQIRTTYGTALNAVVEKDFTLTKLVEETFALY